MTLTQPIKWHGGKHYLAKRIVGLMPPRAKNPNAPAADDPGWLHYVEPYFGGGSVLLANDPEGISEVANDINAQLIQFWSVLSSPDLFQQFIRLCEATPFSEDAFRWSNYGGDSAAQRAVAFFIRYRQSRQALGKDFATVTRNRTRKGMNEQVAAWLGAVEGLPEIHARLKRVLILNRSALAVIRQQDGPRTLFYLDPPYLHETRTATDAYQHEMTADDHAALLDSLTNIKGRFILSGYPSKLYQDAADAAGWHRRDFEIDNKAGGGAEKRIMTEVVWMNF